MICTNQSSHERLISHDSFYVMVVVGICKHGDLPKMETNERSIDGVIFHGTPLKMETNERSIDGIIFNCIAQSVN